MPRPAKATEVANIHGSHGARGVGSHSGHTIKIYADKAIWCETDGRFITPEDVDRKV